MTITTSLPQVIINLSRREAAELLHAGLIMRGTPLPPMTCGWVNAAKDKDDITFIVEYDPTWAPNTEKKGK